MPAIQNQLTDLLYLVKLDGQEITEHGRTFQGAVDHNSTDITLNNGRTRRYLKNAKNTYSFSFTYLPNIAEKTIDGRVGRDYLLSLMDIRAKILLEIKTDPVDGFYSKYVYADQYSESLIRRDMATDCSYYNVTISFREA